MSFCLNPQSYPQAFPKEPYFTRREKRVWDKERGKNESILTGSVPAIGDFASGNRKICSIGLRIPHAGVPHLLVSANLKSAI